MKRHIIALTLVVLSVVALAVPLSNRSPSSPTGGSTGGASNLRMTRFQSYSAIKSFLQANTLYCGPDYVLKTESILSDSKGGVLTGTVGVPGYSGTNNQVAGVDELDTVKTDGEYVYTVSNNTLVILKAYPATEARVVSRISVNGSLQGVFVDGTKLVLLIAGYSYMYQYVRETFLPPPNVQVKPGTQPMPASLYWPISSYSNITAWVFDVSNHDSPLLTHSVTVNGTLVGARLIGDYIYFIATQSIPRCYADVTLPMVILNGQATRFTAENVYHSDLPDYAQSFTMVTALNAINDNQDPTVETFLIGSSSTIYVSTSNFYITAPAYTYGDETVIHRISIDNGDIAYRATGEVPGQILNQFSMDETNSYFRVATSSSSYRFIALPEVVSIEGTAVVQPTVQEPVSGANVYVLDLQLGIVGRLEGLAPGEQFHSARFLGDRAYLVTYKRIDPFFVIDLSDSLAPRILGELKSPGFSDYLQPYDETHIIGIGSNTTDIAWENATLRDGIKISLYDVSHPANPVETSTFVIGDRGSSTLAATDHKAVLFDRALNLFVVPVEVAQIQGDPSLWSYGTPVWQGAYVFNVSAQDGLVFRGGITHLNSGELPSWNNSQRYVYRPLYIGDVLYTISQSMVRMNSLSDLTLLGSVNL